MKFSFINPGPNETLLKGEKTMINASPPLGISSVQYLRARLTVLSGAYLVAPYVRPTTIHFYIKQREKARIWVESLDLRPVEMGGNVSMVLPYDEGVFYGAGKVSGLNVVSKVQLYVDLYNYPARGEEAAEALSRDLNMEWAQQRDS